MNIFDYTLEEIAEMPHDEWAKWRAQWVSDFNNISIVLRMAKLQASSYARANSEANTSFFAAAQAISQRNLCDAKAYGNALMVALDDARLVRFEARQKAERAHAEATRTVRTPVERYGYEMNKNSYANRADALINELISDPDFRETFLQKLNSVPR